MSFHFGMSPFGRMVVGSVTPWYLAGGVSAANCIAAWQPKGAASLAASYVNLANPGTYNLTGTTPPTWNASDGWICADSGKKLSVNSISLGTTLTVVARIVPSLQKLPYYFSGLVGVSTTTQSPLAISGTSSTVDYIEYTVSTSGVSNASALTLLNTDVNVATTRNGVGVSVYRNGIAVADTGDLAANTACTVTHLLQRETFQLAYYGKVYSIAIYNSVLTADQISAIHTAMSAL